MAKMMSEEAEQRPPPWAEQVSPPAHPRASSPPGAMLPGPGDELQCGQEELDAAVQATQEKLVLKTRSEVPTWSS